MLCGLTVCLCSGGGRAIQDEFHIDESARQHVDGCVQSEDERWSTVHCESTRAGVEAGPAHGDIGYVLVAV